jgi:DNA-binding NarL/FixJ family response regulator
MIRVLVVEDHPMFREGLRATLDLCADVEVVATAGTAATALAVAERHHPDVVIMDVQLPDGSGVSLTRTLRDRLPGCKVLVLSSYDDDDTVAAAIQAGALGFVTKDAAGDTIADAVRTVARHDRGLHRRHHGIAGPQTRRSRFHRPRPVPSAIPARARNPGTPRRRAQQRLHRRSLRAEPQDGPQLRVQHPGQARRRIAARGCGRGSTSRAGRRRRGEAMSADLASGRDAPKIH